MTNRSTGKFVLVLAISLQPNMSEVVTAEFSVIHLVFELFALQLIGVEVALNAVAVFKCTILIVQLPLVALLLFCSKPIKLSKSIVKCNFKAKPYRCIVHGQME